MKWIESEDVFKQEAYIARRDIDGVGYLFRLVRNRHYTTTRWDVKAVGPDITLSFKFKSLKAAKELAEQFHPAATAKHPLVGDQNWDRYLYAELPDNKRVEILGSSRNGWDSRHRNGEDWVDQLMTPLESARRRYKLALEDRDGQRQALEAAEQKLADAADAYHAAGGVA